MSKISRRPNRERIKAERKQYKKAQKKGVETVQNLIGL
jgi:hypothetical protein